MKMAATRVMFLLSNLLEDSDQSLHPTASPNVSGFRLSELTCGRVSGFGVRVSGVGSRLSGVRFQVSGFELRVSSSGFRIPEITSGRGRHSGGFQVPGFGFRVLVFGFRVSRFQ